MRLILKYLAGDKTPLLAFEEAKLWAIKYRNSKGYKQRFSKWVNIPNSTYYNIPFTAYYHPGIKIVEVEKAPTLNLNNLMYDSYMDVGNAAYNPDDYNIYIKNNITPRNNYFRNWDDLMAHEAGHSLDNSVDLIDDKHSWHFLNYSDLFPILHQSKSGRQYKKRFEKNFLETNNINIDNTNLDYMDVQLKDNEHRILHDAKPAENYADLIQFRKALYDSKIFNSFTTDTFTKKHLDASKKKFGHLRLFKNYDDSDIIWMMNNIAQNEQDTQDNETNYA